MARGLAALSLSAFLRAWCRPPLWPAWWPCSRVGAAFSRLFTSSIVALERRAPCMDPNPRSSLAAAMMLSRKLFRLELLAVTLLANFMLLMLLPFTAHLLPKLVLDLLLLLLLVPFTLGWLWLLLPVLPLVPLKLVGILLLLLVLLLAPLKLMVVL